MPLVPVHTIDEYAFGVGAPMVEIEVVEYVGAGLGPGAGSVGVAVGNGTFNKFADGMLSQPVVATQSVSTSKSFVSMKPPLRRNRRDLFERRMALELHPPDLQRSLTMQSASDDDIDLTLIRGH
jgi:hypothetical protein